MQENVLEGFRLSPQQEHVWKLQNQNPHLPYLAWCRIALDGRLDVPALRAALAELVAQHEILRTNFRRPPGMTLPLQVIGAPGAPALPTYDLRGLDAPAQAAAVAALDAQLPALPFDLDAGPALRLALLRLAPDRHQLLLALPALCADRATLAILLRLLARAYAAVAQSEALDDAEVLQYADLAAWQHELLASDEGAAGHAYWQQRDPATLRAPALPFMLPRAPSAGARMEVHRQALPPQLAASIAALLRHDGLPPPLFFLACWQILLARLADQPAVCVGVGAAGRHYAELEDALGPCARALPITGQPDPALPFAGYLGQLHETLHTALQWQDCFSWDRLAAPDRVGAMATDALPGFDFAEWPGAESAGPLVFRLDAWYARAERTDLALLCVQDGAALALELHYDAALFDAQDMARLAEQYLALAEQAAAQPAQPIGALPLLSPAARAQLLAAGQGEGNVATDGARIEELFAAQVARTPDAVAVVFDAATKDEGRMTNDEDSNSSFVIRPSPIVHLTYSELDRRANQLAHHLRGLGVGPERCVALALERSAELVTAILGVHKVGGAYLPIDPALPPDYRARILATAQPAALITANQETRDQRSGVRGQDNDIPAPDPRSPIPDPSTIVDLRADWPAIVQQPATHPPAQAGADNLAYVLFTSGSTGAPKGVAVEHRQLRQYLAAILARLDPPPASSFALVSSVAADLGNTMLFPALCGGSLHVVAPARTTDPDAFAAYMRSRRIDYLKIVPTHLSALLGGMRPSEALPGRGLVLGGEATHWELVERIRALAPGLAITNHYGPTETTVGVLTYLLGASPRDPRAATLPLGRPLAGTQVYILDARQQPAPTWMAGELYVGGAQVARGYLNRPDLTAERFVPTPFADERRRTNDEGSDSSFVIRRSSFVRLYKTGDLARWLPDGTVEFLGRIDEQVKIRGFRVELEGIAATLRRHEAIQDTVVVAPPADAAHPQLVAYVVPRPRFAHTFGGYERYRLPNDMAVAQLNAYETDFFYQQIFVARTEFRHGVTLPPGAVVLDVGANIGLFTLYVQQLRPDATVYAFEPAPPVFDVLRANVALYGQRVHLFACGLSDSERTVRFTYYPQSSCQSGYYADAAQDMQTLKAIMLNQPAGAAPLGAYVDTLVAERAQQEFYNCPLRTLSAVIAEQGLARIDLLKIDVEKSEADILAGIAPHDWPKIGQIVIEAHDQDGQVARIRALLERQGYRVTVEQSAFIKDTDLYNIYAVRADATLASEQEQPAEPAPLATPFLEADELHAYLRIQLPEYMQPNAIMLLDALPLTPNGKLDRRALPAPTPAARPDRSFEAPRTPTEELLAAIWTSVLGLARVGVNENFFALGGDSIHAIQVLGRAHEHGVHLTLPQLLQHQTIGDLARALAAEATAEAPPAPGAPFSLISAVERAQLPGELVDAYPLSALQAGMIFHSEYQPDTAIYHDLHTFHLRARFEPALLRRALELLIERHPALRTSFELSGYERPLQLVHARVEAPLTLADLRDQPPDAQESWLASWLEAELRQPFDWRQAPLLRCYAHRRGDATFQFTLSFHHSILDGWSAAALLTELFERYLGLLDGGAQPSTASLAGSMREFIALEQQTQESAAAQAYWDALLADAPAARLPRWAPPRETSDAWARTYQVTIPAAVSAGLQQIARAAGLPLKSVLLAAHLRVMGLLGGQTDVLTGLIANGRPETADGAQALGLFLNTLPLRLALDGGSWMALARAAFAQERESHPHRRYPLAALQKRWGGQALFETAFNYTHYHVYQRLIGVAGLEVLGWRDYEQTNIALLANFALDPVSGQVRLGLSYPSSELDDALARRIGGYYARALAALARAPEGRYELADLLAAPERQQLLVEWNPSQPPAAPPECLHTRFERQVEYTPDAVALVFSDTTNDERRSARVRGSGVGDQDGVKAVPDSWPLTPDPLYLTYAELNTRANRLAHYLRGLGVGPEVRVGLQIGRTPDLVIGVLAVLKAGGAYLPLDPAYPAERLSFMLADSQARVIVTNPDAQRAPGTTNEEFNHLVTSSPCHLVSLEADAPAIARMPSTNPAGGASAANGAYVIYTSGSTGTPKGVLVSHANVTRLLTSSRALFEFGAQDVWTLFHAAAFDFSVWELWGALCHGGRLVVVPYLLSRTPDAFYALLCDARVSVLNQTPSAFRQLIPAALASGRTMALRLVIFGGEALDPAILRPWVVRYGDDRPRLVNMYGITETTVHVTERRLRAPDLEGAPRSRIGRALADLRLYILDATSQPAPIGVAGELHVGGAGLARGYLNRPELTAERFIPNLFAEVSGIGYQVSGAEPSDTRYPTPDTRLYRTGDLGRWLPSGEVEYLGRIDGQVKIRGFRIELGEIAAALEAHPAVRAAVVQARSDLGADPRLVAYVVPAEGTGHRAQGTEVRSQESEVRSGPTKDEGRTTNAGSDPSSFIVRPSSLPSELREFLAARLPNYMLPTAFVVLEALPLTPNGKLDARALPAPGEARPELAAAYVAPRTPAEAALADIWAWALGLARVGIDDNFFALGGDSILSLRVLALAQERGLRFSLQQLFEHQTIGALSRALGLEDGAAVAHERGEPFRLVAEQDRLRLPAEIEDAYPLSALQAGMLFHSQYQPGSTLYQNVSSFRLWAPFDEPRLRRAVEMLIARHPILRTSFDLSGYGEPLQLVHARVAAPLRVEDLRHELPDIQERTLATWFEAEQQRPFDWAQPCLLRLSVHLRDAGSFQWTMAEHHAILDGWSVASMLTELFTIYFGLLGKLDAPLAPPPALTFGDFVALERQTLESDADRDYWRQALSGSTFTALPRWPADLPSAERGAHQRSVTLDAQVSQGLRQLAEAAGVPLKSVLLAAHVRVMGLLSGQADVLTGLVGHSRPEAPDGERVLGLFLNTLPFRMRLRGGTWAELARQTFAAEQELLPFRRYPMAAIQRDLGGQPLFESAFNFINFHVYQGVLGFPGVEVVETGVFQQNNFALTANFDLEPGSALVHLSLDCDSAALVPEQIEAIVGYYARALAAMAREPFGRYETADLLSERERRQLLVEWNATDAAYPRDRCYHELFEAQAARTPSAVAVIFGATTTDEGRRTKDEGSDLAFVIRRSSFAVHLTYAELNTRANQLAHYLQTLGVGPEVRVGICMERSPELLIALLAIFKAGGAFVPIDPAFPAERMAFMLAESQAKVLLTNDQRPTTNDQIAHLVSLSACQLVDLEADRPLILREPVEAPASGVRADNLAYLIYTSGSTGRPKGVLIPHRGLVNYLVWCLDAYTVCEGRGAPVQSTIAADAIFPSLFAPLLVGASVLLMPEVEPLAALQAALQTGGAFSMIKITPTQLEVLNQLLPDVDATGWVSTLVVGAEALRGEVLDFWQRRAPGTILLNEYGPTETVVGCSIYQVTAPIAGAVPIGQPIANTQFYVLDAALLPAPVGVVGELYIGGDGVAWGYLDRPELTAERFIPNPFSQVSGIGYRVLEAEPSDTQHPTPNTRLYRTGDLARYRPDGHVEFLGRRDQQVKLRGYRIELGEIESVLSRHPAVQSSVVVLHERTPADRRLVAYIVPAEGIGDRGQGTGDRSQKSEVRSHPSADDGRWTMDDRTDSAPSSIVYRLSSLASELRGFLAAQLPSYMVPSAFVTLDALPLTPNGKLDRRALPDPGHERPAETSYRAPRTPAERLLADIWARTLGVAQVGIDDSFFALGGDSILSIQIIARARQAGLQLTPQQLFQHQTIAALSAVVGSAPAPMIDQAPVRGPAPLTPIQRWFFAQEQPDPQHYNQALLLEVRESLDVALLERAFQRLLAHHDALRLRFTRTAAGWQQSHAEPDAHPLVDLVDLGGLSAEEQPAAITAAASALQARLDLARGPLVRIAFFRLGGERADRLLIVIHHLVVDGVSWRVLLEDLQAAYGQLARGQEVALPPKTTAFTRWAERLRDYAATGALRQELDYWRAQLPAWLPDMPTDAPLSADANRVATQRSLTVALSADATGALLRDVPVAYHTRIDELLLTALAQTFARWTGAETLFLDLEGHGREDLFEEMDLSRTVGWFTSLFPIALELPRDGGPDAAIKAVKEQLRRLPGRGIGYGILRYLDQADASAVLRDQSAPQVSFNYLGQVDQAVPADGPFGIASEASGAPHSPRQLRSYLLEISAVVAGGRLRLTWHYSERLHRDATIARLAQGYLDALEALIAHCRAQETEQYTPSDFPLARLDQAALDRLARAHPAIEDIYPATELQAGMLFHSLYSPQSAIYHNVLSIYLRAPFDADALRQAINRLVERHPVLRTAFDLGSAGEPLQLVCRSAPIELRIEDLRAYPPGEQARRLAKWRVDEQRRHFDWTHPGLLRFTVHRRSDDSFQLGLTEHHAILDGWSVATMLAELFAIYLHLRQGGASLSPAPASHFRSFVALERQAIVSQADRAYWQRTLHDSTRTLLPRRADAEPAAPAIRQETVALPAEVSAGLRELARQAEAPLRSVLLAAHLRVIGLLSGQTDVLTGFGANGRPDEPDAERALGLFLNIVPLRMRLDGGAWLALVRQTFAAEQELLPHQRYPLAQIQRDMGGQALFDTAFNFVHFHVYQGVLALPGVEVLETEVHQETNYALVANFEQDLTSAEVRLTLDYDSSLIGAAQIARMAGYYVRALAAMAADPAARYETTDLLGAEERRQLLVEWNATAAPVPDTTIQRLFAEQAAYTPDAIALVFDATMTNDQRPTTNDQQSEPSSFVVGRWSIVQLTYAELNRRANQLAHYLRSRGVGPDVRVGLGLERSPELMIALLGVLKAGGAYVPLDPSYPAERLAFMAQDARLSLLIINATDDGRWTMDDLSQSSNVIVNRPSSIVNIDAEWPTIARQPDHDPIDLTSAENLAYVIYTSGSTGRPKGVMIAHRGLGHWAVFAPSAWKVEPGSRVLQFASFSFDASITEVVLALMSGATLCFGPRAAIMVGPVLQGYLRDQAITHAILPPSALATLPSTPLPALRSLTVAGEACPPELVERWSPGRRFINAYGPTETTVCATMQECQAGERPLIGQPIANTQVYVLDRQLQPAPIGVPGELYIGGVQLAHGYLGRPELTAARFVPNPFSQGSGARGQKSEVRSQESEDERRTTNDERRTTNDERRTTKAESSHLVTLSPCHLVTDGTRLYKTGDLVRWLPGSALEYLGRLDHQVKLRGYRIELGEIEAVLGQHPAVREHIVVVREDAPGDKRLVAYVVPAEGTGDRSQKPGVRSQESEVGNVPTNDESDPSSFVWAPSGHRTSFAQELRDQLRQVLPAYMVPSAFVLLDALPLTPSGKIDRRALPAPDQSWLDQQRSVVPPRTPLEAELARIWAEALGLDRVSIHDSFFDLGGHSLLATQIVFRLRSTFDVELPLSRLFETPTVAGLAQVIADMQAEQEDRERAELVALLAELSEEDAVRELMRRRQSADEYVADAD